MFPEVAVVCGAPFVAENQQAAAREGDPLLVCGKLSHDVLMNTQLTAAHYYYYFFNNNGISTDNVVLPHNGFRL